MPLDQSNTFERCRYRYPPPFDSPGSCRSRPAVAAWVLNVLVAGRGGQLFGPGRLTLDYLDQSLRTPIGS